MSKEPSETEPLLVKTGNNNERNDDTFKLLCNYSRICYGFGIITALCIAIFTVLLVYSHTHIHSLQYQFENNWEQIEVSPSNIPNNWKWSHKCDDKQEISLTLSLKLENIGCILETFLIYIL